jgi:hypothetical protein
MAGGLETRNRSPLQDKTVEETLGFLEQHNYAAFSFATGLDVAKRAVTATILNGDDSAQIIDRAKRNEKYTSGLNELILGSRITAVEVYNAIALIRDVIGAETENPHITFVDRLLLLQIGRCPEATIKELDKLTSEEPRFWSALLAHTLAGNIHKSNLGNVDEILSKNSPSIPQLDNKIEKLKQVKGLRDLLPRFLSKPPAATVVKELIDYSRSNNSVSEVDPLGGRLIEQYNSLEPNSPKRSRLLDLRIEVGKKVAEIKEGHENNLAAFSAELTKLMLSSRLSPLERFLTTELLIETDRRTDTPDNPESEKYIRFAKHIEHLKIENCQREVFEDLQELTKARQFWYALLANSLNTKMQHQTNFEPIDKLLASNKHLHQEDPQAKALLAQLGETPRVRDFFPNLLGAAIAKDLDSDRDDFSVEASDL